jgi:hypothetical protein
MKKILLIVSISLIAILLSCSSSSPDTPPAAVVEDNTIPTTCMPLKTLNFWNYAVENRANANVSATSATDHLYVGNDIVQNMITYKEMFTTVAPNGFFSSLLSNNKLRIDGTRLRATGTFNNTIIPNVNVAINLVDFIILKDNAAAGAALSSQSGQVVQSISGYPVTFDYTLKSVSDGSLATFSSNGVTYTNVKKTKIILTATATTVYSGFMVPALQTQDVVVSTLYFAPQIGMVYNLRNFNYQLNTAVATQLQIPASSGQVQEEYIGTYDVTH